jgi:hypothetical protein
MIGDLLEMALPGKGIKGRLLPVIGKQMVFFDRRMPREPRLLGGSLLADGQEATRHKLILLLSKTLAV